MLFNSFAFLIFAAIFFSVWPLARRFTVLRWVTLIIASSVFYGWWDWRYLFLLFATGLIDFVAALLMERYPEWRKSLLVVSMGANLGTLASFKYLLFFTSNLDSVVSTFTTHHFPLLKLALPIGVSFYTFQSMSYTIDVYRRQLKPTHDFLHFFASLSLFPHLVAGPIIRAHDLLPQLKVWRKISPQERWSGLTLITHGFFKKVVIADNLAPIVNDAFGNAVMNTSSVYWWVIVTMFAFQIYCDFSGYSDIAIGLARWMGYEFPINFQHPYISCSLREFWTRWHISLSTWFRDYLYIPLGGSRKGEWAAYQNMWITMVISGFWHGASWNFVVWGALHALYLSMERMTRWPQKIAEISRALATFLVLFQVWIAWVFFRAESFSQAIRILRYMFSFNFRGAGAAIKFSNAPIVWTVLGIAIAREVSIYLKAHPPSRARTWDFHLEPAVLTAMLIACIFLRGPGNTFIYFQF